MNENNANGSYWFVSDFANFLSIVHWTFVEFSAHALF